MFIALRTQLIASLRQERNVAPLGLDALKVILSYKHSVPNGLRKPCCEVAPLPHIAHFAILCDRQAKRVSS